MKQTCNLCFNYCFSKLISQHLYNCLRNRENLTQFPQKTVGTETVKLCEHSKSPLILLYSKILFIPGLTYK